MKNFQWANRLFVEFRQMSTKQIFLNPMKQNKPEDSVHTAENKN
jgi:hypothetical protein